MGTERQGNQALVQSTGLLGDPAATFSPLPAGWVRLFGQQLDQNWKGPVLPQFSGQMSGLQIGTDLLRLELAPGHTDHIGVFYTHAWAHGDVSGLVLGVASTVAGSLSTTTNDVGSYWTHIGPTGWYTDAVLQGSFFSANPTSSQTSIAHMNGTGVTASLEAGYPFQLCRRYRSNRRPS